MNCLIGRGIQSSGVYPSRRATNTSTTKLGTNIEKTPKAENSTITKQTITTTNKINTTGARRQALSIEVSGDDKTKEDLLNKLNAAREEAKRHMSDGALNSDEGSGNLFLGIGTDDDKHNVLSDFGLEIDMYGYRSDGKRHKHQSSKTPENVDRLRARNHRWIVNEERGYKGATLKLKTETQNTSLTKEIYHSQNERPSPIFQAMQMSKSAMTTKYKFSVKHRLRTNKMKTRFRHAYTLSSSTPKQFAVQFPYTEDINPKHDNVTRNIKKKYETDAKNAINNVTTTSNKSKHHKEHHSHKNIMLRTGKKKHKHKQHAYKIKNQKSKPLALAPKSVTKGWTDDKKLALDSDNTSDDDDNKNHLRKPLLHHNGKNVKWPGRSENRPGKLKKKMGHSAFLEDSKLHPFSIARQLKCLQKKYAENAIIEQEIIGRTVEYNDIVLWKIREYNNEDEGRKRFRGNTYRLNRPHETKYAEERAEKKIVLIVHGLVVMGWSRLPCLSKLDKFKTLLGYYMDNLDSFDIYLIPMANPDGVAMADLHHFWNKNASPQKACPGVNLDRNFDISWNDKMSNKSSCFNNFPGTRAFSEQETRAIKKVLERYSHKMVAYFHVHAGSHGSEVFKGDAVLHPKGYTDVLGGEEDKYVDLKGEIDEAMRNTSFQTISVAVESLHNWYGNVYGTSVDYAATIYGIPYCLELVMQIYEDNPWVPNVDEREQNTALTEIWQMVIDVIFDTIYKSIIKPNEN